MTKIDELEQKLCEMERELKNTVNAIEENIGNEISDLRGALAELKESKKESKKEGKWKPKDGEKYWWRNDIGAIDCDEVCNTTAHDWQLKNLPIFKTDQECRRYWHFMDTVKEKSYSFSKEEWGKHNIRKYTIYYDFNRKEFGVDRSIDIKYLGEIHFKTEEDAQYIIDNFKDELMEYWI